MAFSAILAAAPFDDASIDRVRSDERALIAQLQAGDVRALESVFRTRAPALVRFAERLGAPHAVAEDIVTDIFAAVWDTKAHLDPERSLDAYLFRAVRNATFNAKRSDRRESARITGEANAGIIPGFGVAPAAPDNDVEHGSDAALVWSVVRDLPERQRTAVYLRYTRELSLLEIAETMMVTVPAVKNLLQRAHHLLRARLGGVFEGL